MRSAIDNKEIPISLLSIHHGSIGGIPVQWNAGLWHVKLTFPLSRSGWEQGYGYIRQRLFRQTGGSVALQSAAARRAVAA